MCECVSVCVVVVSCFLLQDRSLLKNLALWLGRITLARNKPILHRDLNVKELLLEGYESGRLVACVSFVAKVRVFCDRQQ